MESKGEGHGPLLEDTSGEVRYLYFSPFGQILVIWPPLAAGEAKETFSLFQVAWLKFRGPFHRKSRMEIRG